MRNPSQTGDIRRPQTTNRDLERDVEEFKKKKRAELKAKALKKSIDPAEQKALGHHIYHRERHVAAQLKRLARKNREEELRDGRPVGVDIY